jgi:hypothetical protein
VATGLKFAHLKRLPRHKTITATKGNLGMTTHSQERNNASVNDLFNDEYIPKKSKSERKYENKKMKRSFKNLVRQGIEEELEDWDDYLE